MGVYDLHSEIFYLTLMQIRKTEKSDTNYPAWLESLKKQIQVARNRAALAVNAELINLYHKIGLDIIKRQQMHRWGDKIIQRLATDLKSAFPDMKGFSTSNLKYMRYFAEQCPAGKIGQQPADQLPWFHVITILTKTQRTDREWYAVHAKSRNKIVAEYALRNVNSPMGVAEYKLMASLPKELKTELPSIEEIEIRLAETYKGKKNLAPNTTEPSGRSRNSRRRIAWAQKNIIAKIAQ